MTWRSLTNIFGDFCDLQAGGRTSGRACWTRCSWSTMIAQRYRDLWDELTGLEESRARSRTASRAGCAG